MKKPILLLLTFNLIMLFSIVESQNVTQVLPEKSGSNYTQCIQQLDYDSKDNNSISNDPVLTGDQTIYNSQNSPSMIIIDKIRNNKGPMSDVYFYYNGSYQTWTVPAETYSLTIHTYGAQGNSGDVSGGYGGYATGALSVTPGQVIYIYVGGQNGFNGGGTGGLSQNGSYGGNGGGATDVRVGGTALGNRVIVAGGGGGGGRNGTYSGCQPTSAGSGGSGGGAAGNNGYSGSCSCNGGGTGGGAGTTSSGGSAGSHSGSCQRDTWCSGSAGSLGYGGNGSTCTHPSGSGGAGGGGGGYFGGGAGGNGSDTTPGGGGGGGASYTGGVSNGSTTNGANSGNGYVIISYSQGSGISQSFNYSGALQTWTVPSGVTSVSIEAWGAQGGTYTNAGGLGGYAEGDLAVTPGQVLYIYVGQQPTDYLGGYNGGGAGHSNAYSRGGGGASDIRVGGTSLNQRVLVAGGGGGATNQVSEVGGAGGGLSGLPGVGIYYAGDNFCGHGGTQIAGGSGSIYYGQSTPGSFGQGGNSLLAANGLGGGGGGGWYGGGGGDHGGGGGGSSYIGGVTSGSTNTGLNSGNGLITISYSQSVITVTEELTGFSSCSGTVSAEQSFSASGSSLSANITVTAPTGFEISTTSGGSFSSSLTLTQTGGTVASTTIYVRLSSSATGNPSGNISLTSTGATTQNVAVSGTVSTPTTGGTAAAADNSICPGTSTSISLSGHSGSIQWQQSDNGSSGWANVSGGSGATTTSYTTAALGGTLYFRAELSSGVCSDSYSNTEEIDVTAGWIGGASGTWNTAGNWCGGIPTISTHVSIPNGSEVTIANGVGANCNNLTLDNGATLTIESGGSLITAGTISNSGTVNIEKTIADAQWHYISSPVTNAMSGIFSGDYLQYWTENGQTWTDIASAEHPLTPVTGFALWGTVSKGNYTFSGTPNTGNQHFTLSYHLNEAELKTADGMNLVGNPYPSSIDWATLAAYGTAYVWSPAITNYIYNTNADIAPMQGFFIYSTSNGSSFNLSNANRSHGGTFYKGNSLLSNGLKLHASYGEFNDEWILLFDDNADEGFVLTDDAWKLISSGEHVSQLWSLSPDGKLAIDKRPETEFIQLGFHNQTGGQYSIKLTEIEGISKAELEDTKLNQFHNLSNGAYSFDWNTTDSEERFILHLKATGTADLETQAAQVYAANQRVYVRLSELNSYSEMAVYDLSGRLILSKPLAKSNLQSFELDESFGAYLVQLKGNAGTQSFKIVL